MDRHLLAGDSGLCPGEGTGRVKTPRLLRQVSRLLPFGRRDGDPESVKFRMGLIVAKAPVHVGVLVALGVATIPLVLVLEQQGDIREGQHQIRENQRALVYSTRRNCRRGNIQNAYVRFRVERDPLAVRIFPIINCSAAIRGDTRGVPLERDEQEEYVELVKHGRLPIVAGAHVVGSIPFPPGGPSGRLLDTGG